MPTSQAARVRMNRSPKQERGVLISDAVWAALNEEVQDAEGHPTKRLRQIARKIAQRAEQGDIRAFAEIVDRLAGKATQQVQAQVNMSHEDWLERLGEAG